MGYARPPPKSWQTWARRSTRPPSPELRAATPAGTGCVLPCAGIGPPSRQGAPCRAVWLRVGRVLVHQLRRARLAAPDRLSTVCVRLIFYTMSAEVVHFQ